VETISNGVEFQHIDRQSSQLALQLFSEDVEAGGNIIFLKNLDFGDDW